MKTSGFDKEFDDGNDLFVNLDLSKAKRTTQITTRVNVDFPEWMVDSLDREASRVGVTRQSIIKVWLAERIENITPLILSTANKSFKQKIDQLKHESIAINITDFSNKFKILLII